MQWVHGASVVLSPHGAHLTNALWMARGALLLEVMPWGMWGLGRLCTTLPLATSLSLATTTCYQPLYHLLRTADGSQLTTLQVMPWGMWDYPRTYTGLLKGAGVLHERLLSLRPPAGAP